MTIFIKRKYIFTSLIFMLLILFTASGCSFLEKDVSQEEALKIYDEIYYRYDNENNQEDTIKEVVEFPIKEIRITEKNIEEKNSEAPVETTKKYIISKSGNETNLCIKYIEIVDGVKETYFYFIKDEKYYSSKNNMNESLEEMNEDSFYSVLVFIYYLQIFEIDVESPDERKNSLMGANDLRKGFVSAKKGLLSMEMEAKVDNKMTTIKLEKSLFKKQFNLSECTIIDKKIEDNTLFTKNINIKYYY